jgi:mono/diheme cytochrome c family protein
MSLLRRLGQILAVVITVLVVGGGVAYAWASFTVSSMRSAVHASHSVEFPVPHPLSDEEIAAIRRERLADLGDNREGIDPMAGVDLEAIALERAVERGRHLVQARYACIECHGDDFAGGTMVDDPAIGTLLGPNLTAGSGSRVGEWSTADWDRAVRHGILPDGTASMMPAEDYQLMSDQELSDILAYIRTFPAVDADVTPVSFGPMGTMLMATGSIPLSVGNIADHDRPHLERPRSRSRRPRSGGTSLACAPAATARTSRAARAPARPTGSLRRT